MRKLNQLGFILLSAAIIGCGDSKKNGENLFSFNSKKLKNTYVNSDVLTLELINKKSVAIDSIIYYVNEQRVSLATTTAAVQFPLTEQQLGYQNLKALVFYDGETNGQEITERVELVSAITPKPLSYTIVNTYAHDPKSFTQGLEFYRDTIVESTGQRGSSYIRKYDYKTGNVYKQVDLEQQHFGEGITILDDKLYQLTWQSSVGMVYDAGSLKRLRVFDYDKPVEGWGITNDGKHLYQSDGTEKIWKIDPKSMKMIDHVNVYSSNRKIKSVNELEWIDGRIYGNIWQRDAVAVIDPETGSVTAVIDLRNLRKQLKSPTAEALNGIAYNPKSKTIFITGKNWDKMFEIRISQ